jgi:hypothetical protein
MYVMVNPDDVSAEDLEALENLHFSPDDDDSEIFSSYFYGSA